jgi:hypothetical protein
MALVPPSNIDDRTVRFVVDNTYKSLRTSKAKLDMHHGQRRKVHEFTLYVDIVSGDPDLIERVLFDMGPTFEPKTFVSSCPIQVTQPNGSPAWRFCTTQQVYGAPKANISVRGAGAARWWSHTGLDWKRGNKSGLFIPFENREDPCRCA